MARRKVYTAEQVDEALVRWVELLPAFKKARAAANEAIARMPWWAQPGRASIGADGTLFGGITWVPAIQDFDLPDHAGVRRTIRPSKYDFDRHHRVSWGNRDAVLERQLAGLAEREAAQLVEMEKAGVVGARAAEQKASSALYMARNFVFWGEPSPYRLALSHIMMIAYEAVGSARWSQQSAVREDLRMNDAGNALKDLMPILPPTMAKVASRLIKTGTGPMTACPYWIGQLPDYGHGGRPPADMIEVLRAGHPVGPRFLEAAE